MNFYSGAPLDRMENRRRDRAWLEPQLNDAASRVLVLWRSRHLVAGEGEPLELSGAEAASFIAAGHQTVFLGQLEGRSLIALDLSEIDDPDALPSLTGRGRFQDLREFGANLSFCGGVPTQNLLVTGTPDAVRDEVRRLKDEMGAGGGYILEPGITIQADVPPENLFAMIDEAMDGRA